MADNKTITGLDAATTAALTDLIVLLVSGLSKKMTLTNLKTVLGIPHRGALVTLAVNETGADYTTPAAVPFDAEGYDTDTIHSNSVNNSRLTVPAGVSKVRLSGNVALTLTTSADFGNLIIRKGASVDYIGAASIAVELTSTFGQINIASPILAVTPGDYFELYLTMETDNSITVFDDRSWFAMEIIE